MSKLYFPKSYDRHKQFWLDFEGCGKLPECGDIPLYGGVLGAAAVVPVSDRLGIEQEVTHLFVTSECRRGGAEDVAHFR